MKKVLLKWFWPFITITLAAAGFDSAMASENRSPCQQTAKQMLQACYFDTQDDLRTTQANCTNLGDPSERHACRREARMTSREEAESCKEQFEARVEACDLLGEYRYDPDPLLDTSIDFVDPNTVVPATANPYVSIVAGHTAVLRAGEEGEETVIIHVTEETREIQGVFCRVVVDIALEIEVDEMDGSVDYLPLEVTDDWFAQDVEANVYYCGEISRNFEDGLLTDIDGSFEAGQDYAKAGILIMSYPAVDFAHRQEFALGEAEDIVQYLSTMASPMEENARFPCGPAGGCLMTYDFTPLEPDASEFKYYIPGIGFVLAEAMEDGELTGEREELVCVGDDLEILEHESCEIENPAALIETLCKVSPDAFCE